MRRHSWDVQAVTTRYYMQLYVVISLDGGGKINIASDFDRYY